MKTTRNIDQPLIFTTYDIGRMTGTDPTTVHKWIDKGILKGYRTPGGHRRVVAEDLRQFLEGHHMPVPRELGGTDALRVLLVDDSTGTMGPACRSLKKMRPDWDLVTADNGVAALLMITHSTPDVLVLDLTRRDVDGLAVCEHLRGREETSRIQLVALTSRATGSEERKARSAGAAVCLKKPASASELAVAIEQAVGLRPAEA